jgi:rod shape-determining protein MreD
MKHLLYMILLVVACTMQVILNNVISIKTIVPDFAIIMLSFVALREGRRNGAIYGFITGFLVNSLNGGIFGAGPLIFTIVGFFAGSVLGYRSFHHIFELLSACALVLLGYFLLSHIVLYINHDLFFENLWKSTLPSFLYTSVMLFFLLLCSPPSIWRGRQFAGTDMFGNEM